MPGQPSTHRLLQTVRWELFYLEKRALMNLLVIKRSHPTENLSPKDNDRSKSLSSLTIAISQYKIYSQL